MKKKLITWIITIALLALLFGALLFASAFSVGAMFGIARLGWHAAKAIFGF